MSKEHLPVLGKMKKIARKALVREQYDKVLSAVAVGAELLYSYNQEYCDDEFEEILLSVSDKMFSNRPQWSPDSEKKTVLFYDGFGEDTRGLALIFLKGLVRKGYRVVYATVDAARGKQPQIARSTAEYGMEWVYLPCRESYVQWAEALHETFEKYHPHSAFFYTLPYDVTATVVFDHYRDTVKRYQIDLTDHAFWLGKKAFDICLALRDVGSKIAVHYRGIPAEQIRMLPYYAPVDIDAPFEGFPFPMEGRRLVFSGGALYKTLGDKDNLYYKMVDSLLRDHEDLVFLYAGSGDDSQLKRILEKYPDRAFFIAERKDLFQVLKQCVFYLNTYPMFGGMMMNFAARAGKLPLTLKHNNDADGLLFNQKELGIEYDAAEDLLADADRLLSDEAYRQAREAKLSECVITQDRFEENLASLIEKGNTEFPIYTDPIDTTEFRREYITRFRYKQAVRESILYSSCHRPLIPYFPVIFGGYFVRATLSKIKAKFGRKKA
ncbi:MAG: hypothetical protein J6M34_03530 [Clostridia bacterium]|nr:hypothetical protein [Clostridia bacterium]